MNTPNGVSIQSIMFGATTIEVSYFEERDTDRDTGIQEIRTVMVPTSLVADELGELAEDLEQLLNRVGVLRRNPPAVLSR